MEHAVFLLEARHITILYSFVKESSVFIHKFNFCTRGDATGTNLNVTRCSVKTKITSKISGLESRLGESSNVW
jgi:hypothetical protein